MELIDDFDMPDFTRKIWVSKEAREKWEQSLEEAKNFLLRLEWESVKHGLRDCSRMSTRVENYEERVEFFRKHGLYFLPVTQYESSGDGFSHTLSEEQLNSDNVDTIQGVVSRDVDKGREFVEASRTKNHRRTGELLGFPECCCDFFDEVWSKGYYDPVWQQAVNTPGVEPEEEPMDRGEKRKLVELDRADYNPYLFSGLRYIGLRFIPFWACSFDCSDAAEVADEFLDLAYELNPELTDDLDKVLNWPIEWSCLKGIAIVSTPVFRLSTASLACYPEHVVRLAGEQWPAEGPQGLEFPWDSEVASEAVPTDNAR